MLASAISFFKNDWDQYSVDEIGDGRIHASYKISREAESFFLQKINTNVFSDPAILVGNHWKIQDHLSRKAYPFWIPKLIAADNYFWFKDEEGGAWKATEYLSDTSTFLALHFPEQAFEGASAFAKFQSGLADIKSKDWKETIPGFHAINGRAKHLEKALAAKSTPLSLLEKKTLEGINNFDYLLKTAAEFCFIAPKGMIHGDTKISNLLFDASGQKVKAVIDWDTVMNDGLFWDFGDMVRTYVPNKSEDEKAYLDINIRPIFLEAICAAFLAEATLPKKERASFVQGSLLVIYIQLIRFFTDHLLGNSYYKTTYENQNLFRSLNQLRLLESLASNDRLFKRMLGV